MLLLVFWGFRLQSTCYRCCDGMEVAKTIRSVSTLFYQSTRRIHPTVLEPASYKKRNCQIMKTFLPLCCRLFFFTVVLIRVLKSARRILWSRFQYVVDGVRVFAIKHVCRI